MIRTSLRTLALATALLAAAPAAAQNYPSEPGDGIADRAGILTRAQEDSIRRVLYALRDQPGVEVRVLTVQSYGQYRTGHPTPESFATGVYNEWKLGMGQKQDGVLVMVSVDDRFARIELGDGVPAHQDARMQRIMDEVMVPRFRESAYGPGVVEGVAAVARAFRDSTAFAPEPAFSYTPAPEASGPSAPQPAYGAPSGSAPGGEGEAGWLILGAAGLGAAGVGAALWARYRKRSCAQCGRQMQRLDEGSDDVYLDSGRRLEEVMGSVDYDVWHCAACGNHQVLPYAAWFSGKRQCPSCRYQTVDVSKTVLERPTYESTGRERIEQDCRHCHWSDEDIVVLPRLVRTETRGSSSRSFSSSGGSSSGGGWSGGGGGGGGGGSSSGRGASGRW